MRHVVIALAIVASSLAIWSHVWTEPPPPAPARRPSVKELVAVRRLAAHDAAVRRNAEARHRCELSRTAHASTFGVLYGAAPATPGTAFATTGSFEITREERGGELIELRAIVAQSSVATCESHDDPEIDCPFRCTDDSRADCWALERQLDAAWGSSDEHAWLDGAKRMRAMVHWVDDVCELAFDRHVPPRAWLGTEIPVALLGAAASRLPSYADDNHSWPLSVTGDYMTRVSIEAVVRDDRIVGLVVTGLLDDGGADELHDLVTPWRGRIPIALHTRADRFELRIGEASP